MSHIGPVYRERNFFSLPFSGQLLIWSLRLWVRAAKQETSALPMLEHGFELAGLGDAAEPLDQVMTMIAVSSRITIDIRCVPCRTVSRDEERLLAHFADTRSGTSGPLAVWLPPTSLRACRAPSAAVTHSFAAAGLALSQDLDPDTLPIAGQPLSPDARLRRILH